MRSDAKNGVVRTVRLELRGSPDTDEMLLYIPQVAKLQALDLNGQHLVVPPGVARDTRLVCSRDCRDEAVTLTLAGDISQLEFAEER